MSPSAPATTEFRILIIDDTVAIHDDIRKILNEPSDDRMNQLEEAVLDITPASRNGSSHFEIDSAYQGEEGIALVRQSVAERRPYSLVFLDMRMPPGMDGLDTMRQLWKIDADLQIVICTAFSDYSWNQIVATTGPTARLIILRKPFEPIEVTQLAHTLTEKWRLERQARRHASELQDMLVERTKELAESQMVFQLILEEKIQEARHVSAPAARPRR